MIEIGFQRLIGKADPPHIKIITDGSFIDTALFFVTVAEASKKISNATLVPVQCNWANIAHTFSKSETAIAYLNRRELPDITGDFQIWSNLCSFHGYALLGRNDLFSSPIPDLRTANRELERAATQRKLTIINFSPDLNELLQTPLTPILNSSRVEYLSYPVEEAFEKFLSGKGDLFLAGLPQRLKCSRLGMTEVITSQIHPLLLGIDALIYKDEDKYPIDIVETIASTWSHISRRMASDESFCLELYDRWLVLASDLEIAVNFPVEDFLLVTHHEAGKYIRFFRGRDDATSELIRATEMLMSEDVAASVPRKDRKELLSWLHQIFKGRGQGL